MARYLKLGKLKNIFSPTPTLLLPEQDASGQYRKPGPTRRIDGP